MSDYTTESIRNIALVGHAGAGKTSLIEALLYRAGTLSQQGNITKGNTLSDFTPEEKHYQHSLYSSVAATKHNNCHINLFDTPGYPDFIGQTLGILPAADALAIVINGENGIEHMTRQLMDWAGKNHYCRFIIINKIDCVADKLEGLLEEIRSNFGKECLPINLPAKDGKAVVDCFFHESGQPAFSSVAQVHTNLVDQVVEVDPDLMSLYLEQGEISAQQLHEPFEKALRDGHIIPVCFTSAEDGTGIEELLDIFVQLMPNPMEGTPHPFVDEHVEDNQSLLPVADAKRHVIAHVVKIIHDPFVGKMGLFRIHQGTMDSSTQLLIGEQRKPFKVGHLFQIQGKDHVEIQRGIPGDICAVAKIDELSYNSILHNSHDEDHIHALDLHFPAPMLGLSIVAKKHGDEQKLSEALEKISAEDPCLLVEINTNTHETILRGMGELHLRIAIDKLLERYHVEVETHTPSIAYRETINQGAEGHFRHKKQSGGAGQFGEVFLEIAPLERGAGFEFVNKVVGGTIPGQFIPAIEKGVRQALAEGAIAGFAIQDVKVTVLEGKHHSVDSNEISFVTAGRKAFLAAIENAHPIILEPVMRIEVTVPQANMGDISGDLAARRGQINDTQSTNAGTVNVSALVPLAELDDYQSHLKSLTGGKGVFITEFSNYQPVPPNIQKKLIAKK